MPRLSKIGAAALAAFGWTSGVSAVSASYLVVAGGGGGGAAGAGGGGGGGAGGFRTGTLSLTPASSYTVTVGAGGAGGTTGQSGATGDGTSGSDSILSTITSTGGGGGGAGGLARAGKTGGSGGGGGHNGGAGGAGNTPSTTPSQGNNGGTPNAAHNGGGGGGGASAVGATTPSAAVGGAGGAGTASSISGSSVTYAGGGGGSSNTTGGAGGAGGGGAGGIGGGASGTAGTANLGGGGGGGYGSTGVAAAGGSGIVIISYAGAQQFGGGVVTSVGGNTIHTFTTSGTLVPVTPLSASYLVVAGGGAGARHSGAGAGGGGAGGLLSGSGLAIDSNSTYLVTVGAGGTIAADFAAGGDGTNSTFSMVTTSAVGGGGGGAQNSNGRSGGSGGGGTYLNGTGGAGTSGQGNNGGSNTSGNSGGGGGGGAGAVGSNSSGSNGGNGGNGTASSITGSSVTYAGGGGGGTNGATPGSGGTGGGGTGANASGGNATAGTANLGGGGGGAGYLGGTAGNGGSGVVIISYPGSTQQMAGGTVTITGGNVIHTFTSSGYLTPLKLVNNSLRFRSSASAYLNRTPATAGNRRTWTWSGWVKRGRLSVTNYLFSAPSTSSSSIFFSGVDRFHVTGASGAQFNLETTSVYRDISAWYHIVVALDTTQATSTDRLKIYVNGNQLTAFASATYPSLNLDGEINNNIFHQIGRPDANTHDGYLTEINFIDGQALTPNSFGTFNSYGVWQPITYGGSYGTNGFYLPFTNKTSTTTLGYDFSPNGNNWTTNNISLTAGATYDSMTDVPTLTSATAANYAVLNPLSTLYTVTAGNLDFTYTNSTSGVWYLKGTLAVSSDKYYWEVTPTNVGAGLNISIGIILSTNTQTNTTTINLVTDGYVYHSDGNKYSGAGGTTGVAYGATYTNNDVIGVALDLTAGTLVFYKNNVSQGTAFTGLTSSYMLLVCNHLGGTSRTVAGSVNAGQRPFTYTPPTGFVALNTQNLPTPTISNGANYMAATLYTGNGGSQSIANTVNGISFQPDWVWIKGRSGATDHALTDAVRGVTKELKSNTTGAETTAVNGLTAFNSGGFSIGTAADYNTNAATYVGWQWKEGATQGFDIVTYTGNQTAGKAVPHSLGVAPAMIIVKARGQATSWPVYHQSLGATKWLLLNSTQAVTTTAQEWDNQPPSSTNFYVGNSSSNSNQSTNYVAYLFAEVAGFSRFGSYTGNGSTDGPFVFLGFRPRFIMFKRTDSTGSWFMEDSSRGTYNVMGPELYAESSAAEATATRLDFLSNGFKMRAANAGDNANGGTYVYMAFCENPFKLSLAR